MKLKELLETQNFKYPIFKKDRASDMIVKFTDLTTAEVISGHKKVGHKGTFIKHTDKSIWVDVEKPSSIVEGMKKYTDFDKDFWEKFEKCVEDKEWYKLDRKGDKTTIFYDRKKVGIYNHKEKSLTTDHTDYFVLPAKCAK